MNENNANAPPRQGISMLAADEVVALDVITCFVQDRHSVLFRKCEDSRKIGNLDETKVNSYIPKTLVELF